MRRVGGFVLLCMFACATGGDVGAQTASETSDFSFKRVAVPTKGATKRITVQIDPDAEVYHLTPGSTPRRPGDPRPESATQLPAGLMPEGPSDFDWYWELVSPSIDADPAQRFSAALSATQKEALKIGTPRLQTLQRIIETHGTDILMATIGTDISPALVLAVIAVESGGRATVTSHAGAQGMMQLMPATAKRFDVSDSMDPRQNIKGGVAYLDWLLKEFNRDPVLALAGYNAGEGAIGAYQGVPPYAETRAYVPKVLAAWSVARSLCLTPPDLISDGCVFVSQRIASDG